jgi:hypothetical protein
MVSIPLGLGDWESTTQDMSRLKLHNMYVVANPSTPDNASRVSRPTLTTYATVGAGPVTRLWQQPNILQGDTLVVSGTELFRLKPDKSVTKIGDIPGTGLVDVAGNQLEGQPDVVLLVRDGLLYSSDGLTLSPVAIPDNQPVSSVATLNSYFIFSITNTQKFYWLEPGSLTVDPLNFASAERIPDPIISVNIVSDEIWFLGLSGPEVWSPTGDKDAPFQRVSGRVYKEGCHSRDTVVTTAIDGLPALIWVTDTKAVVKAQGAPAKVSNESVEEILKTSDDLSSWLFRYNRHDFYLVNSPLFTLVYDITANLWSKWDTYLLPFWAPQTGIQTNSTVLAGDSTSNKLFILEEGVGDDTLPVVREVSGFLPAGGRPVKVGEVIAYVNSGWSPSYNLTPRLELRWSDDLGATWSDYVEASLGERGDYSRTVAFRSLGLLRNAGRIFEFRISDFVRFRIDYCTMNERKG